MGVYEYKFAGVKQKNTAFLLLFFLSFSSFRQVQNMDEWVYEREKKGIKVFTKKSKWGHLRDSKVTMLVSAKPEEVVKYLSDFDNYPNWFPRCKKGQVVAKLNDNEFIAYLVFNAPWPVADRDCVLRVKTERDKQTGTITITQTSEPKCVARKEGCIRIEQIISVWKMVPKNGGTEITNEYSSNPGGNIPDWLINTQSVENPMVTFENLQGKVVTKK